MKVQVPVMMKRRLCYWVLNSETEKISHMELEEPAVCRKSWESGLRYLTHKEGHPNNEKVNISIRRILSLEIDVNFVSGFEKPTSLDLWIVAWSSFP